MIHRALVLWPMVSCVSLSLCICVCRGVPLLDCLLLSMSQHLASVPQPWAPLSVTHVARTAVLPLFPHAALPRSIPPLSGMQIHKRFEAKTLCERALRQYRRLTCAINCLFGRLTVDARTRRAKGFVLCTCGRRVAWRGGTSTSTTSLP